MFWIKDWFSFIQQRYNEVLTQALLVVVWWLHRSFLNQLRTFFSRSLSSLKLSCRGFFPTPLQSKLWTVRPFFLFKVLPVFDCRSIAAAWWCDPFSFLDLWKFPNKFIDIALEKLTQVKDFDLPWFFACFIFLFRIRPFILLTAWYADRLFAFKDLLKFYVPVILRAKRLWILDLCICRDVTRLRNFWTVFLFILLLPSHLTGERHKDCKIFNSRAFQFRLMPWGTWLWLPWTWGHWLIWYTR